MKIFAALILLALNGGLLPTITPSEGRRTRSNIPPPKCLQMIDYCNTNVIPDGCSYMCKSKDFWKKYISSLATTTTTTTTRKPPNVITTRKPPSKTIVTNEESDSEISKSKLIQRIESGEYYASATLLAQLANAGAMNMEPEICYNDVDRPDDLETATFSNGSQRYPDRESYEYFACPLTGKLRDQSCCGLNYRQYCCDGTVTSGGLSVLGVILICVFLGLVVLISILLICRCCWVLRRHGKFIPACCGDCDCCEKKLPIPRCRTRHEVDDYPELRPSTPNISRVSEQHRQPPPRSSMAAVTSPPSGNNAGRRQGITFSTPDSAPISFVFGSTPSYTTATATSAVSSRRVQQTRGGARNRHQANSRPSDGGRVGRRSRSESRPATSASPRGVTNDAYTMDDLPSYSELFRADGTETNIAKRVYSKAAPPPYHEV